MSSWTLLGLAAGGGATGVEAQPQPRVPYKIPEPIDLGHGGVATPGGTNAIGGVASPKGANATTAVAVPEGANATDAVVVPKRANVAVAGVLGQLETGQITAEQAWATNDLSIDDVVHAANTFPISDLNEDKVQSPLLSGLVQLLVQHGQERWMPAKEGVKIQGEPLSSNVRLAVADALSSVHDERAVAVYEELLKETESSKDLHSAPRTVGALNHLASYYWDQGQLQKAATVFASGDRYSSSPEWAAATRLDEARVYAQMGDAAKSQQLYDQIADYGSGWITVLSLYDKALPLIDAGKLDEARAILSRPLNATVGRKEGEMAQNAWLASLDYRQGKLEAAYRHGEASVKAGQGVKLQSASMKNLFDMGHDIYLRSGGWKTQPVQCDVKEVVLKVNPSQPDQPLYARFRIKTYGSQPVTAIVDNPDVQVRVLPIDNWQKNGLEAQEEEKEVILQVRNNLTAANTQKRYGELSLKTQSFSTKVSIALRD